MKELELLALIASGESESLDFKRELRLDDAKGKAELVKDVIAIANSVRRVGYLLVGVADDRTVPGIAGFEEERLQQIVHTYVSPAIVLRCSTVPVVSQGFAQVGVLEIRPTGKPHQVGRPIDRLKLHQVFVRHGTTTAEASPEEMFRMRDWDSRIQREAREYVQGAEKHHALGNADETIRAYSRAIELTPTPELFIARGKAYGLFRERGMDAWLDEDKVESAEKDFAAALKLADSTEVEKSARLERLRLCGLSGYGGEYRQEDFEWLCEETEALERAETLLLYVKSHYHRETMGSPGLMAFLNEAIELGWEAPEVFYLRAIIHSGEHNDGLALENLGRAMNVATDVVLRNNCLAMRTNILVHLRKYEEALEALSSIDQASEALTWVLPGIYNLQENVLYEIGMAYMAGRISMDSIEPYKSVLHVLLGWLVRHRWVLVVGDTEFEVPPANLEKDHPKIAPALLQIVGRDFWQALHSDSEIVIHI